MRRGVVPVMGMGEPVGPGTSMMIRAAENGWVLDVELEGDALPEMPEARQARFAKIVARTPEELVAQVNEQLDAFAKRTPVFSNRVAGGVMSMQVTTRQMTIIKLHGGYIVFSAQPVKKTCHRDEQPGMPTYMRRIAGAVTIDGENQTFEYTDTESIEQVIVSRSELLEVVTSFFGLKGE